MSILYVISPLLVDSVDGQTHASRVCVFAAVNILTCENELMKMF